MGPVERIRESLADPAPPEGRVLVAVSGGADSTALLLALVEILGAKRVAVGHLDHGLRPESGADAEFVRRLAARVGVPAAIERRSVRRRRGESPEDAARRVRYGFLADAAAALSCTWIATAHHMDDQAETVLYRAATGTGIAGLRGIRAVRKLANGPPVRRPLLGVRRDELRAWLTSRGEAWREDPTNAAGPAEGGNVRAALRRDVIPALSTAVARDVVPLLARLAANASCLAEDGAEQTGDGARVDAPAVRRTVRALVAIDADRDVSDLHRPDAPSARIPSAVLALGPSARRVVFEEAVLSVRGRVPSAAETVTLLAALREHRAADLRGLEIRPTEGGLVLRPAGRRASAAPVARSVSASVHAAGNDVFLTRLRAAPGSAEILDADRVALPVTLSVPHAGERFHALGASAPQRIGHYLQRRGVPAAARATIPVVRDASGAAIWIVGHGIAKRAAVDTATRSVLLLVVGETAAPG